MRLLQRQACRCVLVTPFLLFSLISTATSTAQPCLYAVYKYVGKDKVSVASCSDGDPLRISESSRVLAAMKALGIDPGTVTFQGCTKADFKTIENNRSSKQTFVVTYPIEVDKKYLAPILHELMHVAQIKKAGNIENLQKEYSSLQIELAADFLVGYFFARLFQDTDRVEFQHNLFLVGAYMEENKNAHGTPEQRTSAFRLGSTNAYPYPQLDYWRASGYFLENDFTKITIR